MMTVTVVVVMTVMTVVVVMTDKLRRRTVVVMGMPQCSNSDADDGRGDNDHSDNTVRLLRGNTEPITGLGTL